jgi:hypothetical protein
MLTCNFSSHAANLRKRRFRMDCRVKPGNDEQKSSRDACDSLSPAGRGRGEGARRQSICFGLRAPSSCPSPRWGEGTKPARRAPLFGLEADRVSNFTLATPVRPSFAKAKFTKSHSHEKRRAFLSGAPGGAGVVGHATRTDVTTRPRFGRGARHRTIRLREPPASGALRLPALHHHRGSPPRLSTAAA